MSTPAKTFNIGGDLEVNRLGFGAMRLTGKGIWGEPKEVDEAKRVLKRAVELGVNFIDTAEHGTEGGQPFTYDLFDALRPPEFERRGSWSAGSSEPPNCCWAYGITPQFRRDSIRRDPSTAVKAETVPGTSGTLLSFTT